MPAIYLWYPFDDGTGFDTLDGLARAFGSGPSDFQSPKWGELYRIENNASTTPGGLWDATLGDEIYVIGHATSGEKVLADANKQMIDQSEVVKRLGECGLQKARAASIVLYACYSGRGDGCLAEKVATRLMQLGYASAGHVYGFMKKVGMKAKSGGAQGYELRVDMGAKGHPNWMGLQYVRELVYRKVDPVVH